MNGNGIKSYNKPLENLRWIAFLPGAFLGAWLAWILINIFGRFSLSSIGIDYDSFLGQLYFNTAGNVFMGLAFVYTGAKIAPSHRIKITYILAGTGLILGGFLLYPLLMVGDLWGIWGAICIILGIGTIVYFIQQGDTDIE